MASDRARRALARLAGEHFGETAEESTPPTATAYGGIIAEATAALEDIEAAAEFVDGGGLDTLERAVERAEGDLSERARQGARRSEPTAPFAPWPGTRTTQVHPRCGMTADRADSLDRHFRPGRSSHLGTADVATIR